MIEEEGRCAGLLAVQARDGGYPTDEAGFRCPICGIKPILFEGNFDWNEGMPMVECLCACPFSPKPEVADLCNIWAYPMTRNAEAWGLFVQWRF